MMLRPLLLSALVALAPVSVHAAEWSARDCPLEDATLKQGKLQVCEKTFEVAGEGEKKGVMGIQLINAPYDRVWGVISDWEAQASFVPGLKYFKTRHVFPGSDRDSRHSLMEARLDIPFLTLTYTVDAHFEKPIGKMTWNMLSADDIHRYQAQKIPVQASDEERLKNVEGYAWIVARDDTHTLYYYAPVIETSVPVPDFVQSAIVSVSLNQYMDAIKKRAETPAKP